MKRTTMLFLATTLLGGCYAKKVKTLEGELAQRDAQIVALDEANQGCVVEVSTLRDEIDRVRRKNKELAAYYEALLDEFGPRMEDGTVELVLYPDRSVLSLSEDIHFATGSATLNADGRAAVVELAELIQRHPDRRFQVEGHTDPRPIAGTYDSNWELGAQRAINVVKALSGQGVSERQLSAATYAATSPVASNSNPTGMAENRRIAVSLQTTLEETAAHQALLERAEKAQVARVVGQHPDDRVATED